MPREGANLETPLLPLAKLDSSMPRCLQAPSMSTIIGAVSLETSIHKTVWRR